MAASKDMGLVPSQRLLDNNSSQLLFPDDSLRFNCGSATHQRRVVGDPGPKTRELTGFIDDKMFGGVDRDQRYFQSPQGSEYRRSLYGNAPERRDCPESQNWNGNGNGSARTPSVSDGSEEDDDDDEEDDDDDDEVDEVGNGVVEGLINMNCNNNNNNNNNNSSGSVHSSAADKTSNDAAARNQSSFGSNKEVMIKDGIIVQSLNNSTRESPGENHQQVRASHYQNANAMAEPDGDMYYSQLLRGSEGSGQRQIHLENGRKDGLFFSEPGNSLKTILSDPLTGALMDDAMILPCGHSFGGGGIQHVLKMKACYTCSQSILEESLQRNLSLRAAVMAFRREEELRSHRTSKRRREKFEDKNISGDSSLVDASRGRGVQFPFAVTDRVVIKGNKRTPERFVGREAVVTTQCLNGWYVVKTLDNAESVKLQYRSLAKVADNSFSKPMSNKMTPNWL